MYRPILAFSLFLFSFYQCNGQTPFEEVNGRCVAVMDGDTFKFIPDGKDTVCIVRLEGIDAPESSQAYGQEARAFLNQLLYQKNIRIEIHSEDNYNRYLCFAYFTQDGENAFLNEYLIATGNAWHYSYYTKNALFARLQAEAKDKKLGLWGSSSDPENPYEYRKRTKQTK